MSWLTELYQTYEHCVDRLGDKQKRSLGDKQDHIPFAPYCHSDRPVHIEIVLDGEGNFLDAYQVALENTIIPITEQSAGRTSKAVPHPLCDKLQYVAGDYKDFGGEKPSYIDNYLNALKQWCASPYSHQKIQAVYTYVTKRCMIRDLVKHGVLYADNKSGKLMKTWNGKKEDKPKFFSYFKNSWQAESFVRWRVKMGEDETRLWLDRNIWRLWQAYYASTLSQQSLCYVTGNMTYLASSHLKRLRANGDNAKLISANDETGYTYRGRFTDEEMGASTQACGIGFDVSQKAHNTLRWLIDKQGWTHRSGDSILAFVAWAVSGAAVPSITDDSYDTYHLFKSVVKDAIIEREPQKSDTAQDIGTKLSRLLAGYSEQLKERENVVVLGLNSATRGRMAVIYYRKLTGSEFLERVRRWHTKCAWHQQFSKEKRFIGAPSPKSIAKAAFGKEEKDNRGKVSYTIDDKLCNATVERIIPCIIDGLPIPQYLVEATTRRACKRQSLDWEEWEKTLGIACSLYKYDHFTKTQEELPMGLDRKREDRSYLYGRLLAVADCIESFALREMKQERLTRAERRMQRFADHPCSTWKTIVSELVPYKERLGGRIKKYDRALSEIMELFDPDQYKRDTPLSGEFLLGFYTQRTKLKKRSNFEITQKVLQTLENEDIPEQIFEELELLQDEGFETKDELLDAIEEYIGEEETHKYGEIILKHARKVKKTKTLQETQKQGG